MSNYPIGASRDSRAPWNEPDVHYVKCEDCNGTGYHYTAYDIYNNKDIECTEETYHLLPDTIEEAEHKNQNYVKGEAEQCECCSGEGKIEYCADYEPDYDDYYSERLL